MDHSKPIQISEDIKGFAVSPIENCPHFQAQTAIILQKLILANGIDFFKMECQKCNHQGENWVCLTCQGVFCSRFVQSHMVQHYESEHHSIALSFLDFSFWCYDCDSYITNRDLQNFQKNLSEIRFGDQTDINSITQLLGQLGLKPKEEQKEVQKITYNQVIDGLKQKKFQNVFFLVGAGISVAAGIPDFRSPGTGLYSQLEKYNLPTPEAIFDINFFKQSPQAFYTLAKSFLLKFKGTPVKAHKFIKKIEVEGILNLCFSQNIDGLELEAGLSEEKLLQAHGHMRTCHCLRCNQQFESKQWFEFVEKEEVMKCNQCDGLIKPDVVFFGEALPKHFLQHYNDISCADLVIVMGTSLKVMPFAALPSMVKNKQVPFLLINRENPMEQFKIDDQIVFMAGDIEENIEKLCNDLGWQL